jgi:hypothetical protein
MQNSIELRHSHEGWIANSKAPLGYTLSNPALIARD